MFIKYQYLFYRIYAWHLRTWGEIDAPEFGALFGVSLLLYINVLSLLFLFETLLQTGLFFVSGFGKWHSLLLLLIITVPNYLIFIKDKKYKELVKIFGKENEEQKKKGFLFCFLYVVFSILFLIISVILFVPQIKLAVLFDMNSLKLLG